MFSRSLTEATPKEIVYMIAKIAGLTLAFAFAIETAGAQTYSLQRSVIGGGGTVASGSYAVFGSVNQPGASLDIHAGNFLLVGGFWGVRIGNTSGDFDAASDFSSTANSDATTWSYRYKNSLARDGNYPLLPGFGATPAETAWTPGNPDPGAWTLNGDVPMVGVNRTGADRTYAANPPFPWPSDAMLLHPGNGKLVVVSWLCQTTALANISFRFSDLDPNGGNGIAWFVERNDFNHTLAAGSFTNGGASASLIVSNIAMFAGDRINFIADPNGDYSFDSSRLNAVISTKSVENLDLRILALARTGNDLLLSYNSFAGRNFALQSRGDLKAGTWTSLPGKTNTGDGGMVQVVLSNALVLPQQFYRVQMLP